MKKLRGSRIGIDQGDDEVFSEFAAGGSMWTGEGNRERRKRVKFSEPFRVPPAVHAGLSLWDVDQRANVRAELVAEKITKTGFDLVLRTWSATRIARVRMNWLAIGEIASEDDWDV